MVFVVDLEFTLCALKYGKNDFFPQIKDIFKPQTRQFLFTTTDCVGCHGCLPRHHP